MTPDEFFAAELARHERGWLAGDFRSLTEAFLLCTAERAATPGVGRRGGHGSTRGRILRQAEGRAGPDRRSCRGRARTDIHRIRWNACEARYAMRDLLAHVPPPPGKDPYPATWGRRLPLRLPTSLRRGARREARRRAIEKSHKLVRRAIRNGNGARFGVID